MWIDIRTKKMKKSMIMKFKKVTIIDSGGCTAQRLFAFKNAIKNLP